jgi:HTH-type transcriptional regulator / antitoxin HipB
MYIRRAGDLGALVRDKRKAANLTQGDLAARLGTSQRWISELERGKPTAELEMALRALHALGLSLTVETQIPPDTTGRMKPAGASSRSQKAPIGTPRINVNDLVDD